MPGPSLVPASGENGAKTGAGAFGSQVDLAAASMADVSLNGTKPQTLPPVAETPAKDAAVRCGARAGFSSMPPPAP